MDYISKFHGRYNSLFSRFYKAVETVFLRELLISGYDWEKPQGIGFSYFVKLREDNVILMDYRDEENCIEYPNFVGMPIDDVWEKMDKKWRSMLGDYFYALETKVVPAFWSDLCWLIMNERMNLDILDINTPQGMTKISYRDGYLFIYSNDGSFVYSKKRLPPEHVILKRIKALY